MRIAIVWLVSMISIWAQGSQPTDSRGWTNRGVELFRNAKYQEAIDAFQRAADLDPNNASVHLYLATAYMQVWIPGADSPENLATASRAEVEFKRVLELNPNDTVALASLTSLSYHQSTGVPSAEKTRKLEQAREWNGRLLAIDPQDKEAHYWAGVFIWSEFYPALMTTRANAHMKAEDPGPLPSIAARQELLVIYGQMVDDGIAHLRRAIEIDPQYEDAMSYLNLLIRERADYYRDTPDQYRQDIQEADGWVRHALDTKKQKAQTGLATTLTAPLPPPPPPPPPPAGRRADAPGFTSAPPVNFDPVNPANPQRTGVAGDFNPSNPPTPDRIRVDGNVQAFQLIRKIDPICSPLAVQARIQGVVKFTMIIARDGTVQNIQVISGHPLLVPPAVEAVKQWQYKPTLLNGTPIEVITQVDVNMPCGQ